MGNMKGMSRGFIDVEVRVKDIGSLRLEKYFPFTNPSTVPLLFFMATASNGGNNSIFGLP